MLDQRAAHVLTSAPPHIKVRSLREQSVPIAAAAFLTHPAAAAARRRR